MPLTGSDSHFNEFPGVFNIAKLADSIRLSSRASEVSRTISVSNNLTVTNKPAKRCIFKFRGRWLSLSGVDIDGSEDLANAWVDLRNVTQYPNRANTNNNRHFPKFLQFGGHGTNREFSTAEIGEFIAFDKFFPKKKTKSEGYLFNRWVQMFSVDPSHPYASAPPDWSPVMRSSLQAWFDANDSSTINKNFVKKWTDSANQNEFSQADLPNRPAVICQCD